MQPWTVPINTKITLVPQRSPQELSTKLDTKPTQSKVKPKQCLLKLLKDKQYCTFLLIFIFIFKGTSIALCHFFLILSQLMGKQTRQEVSEKESQKVSLLFTHNISRFFREQTLWQKQSVFSPSWVAQGRLCISPKPQGYLSAYQCAGRWLNQQAFGYLSYSRLPSGRTNKTHRDPYFYASLQELCLCVTYSWINMTEVVCCAAVHMGNTAGNDLTYRVDCPVP